MAVSLQNTSVFFVDPKLFFLREAFSLVFSLLHKDVKIVLLAESIGGLCVPTSVV